MSSLSSPRPPPRPAPLSPLSPSPLTGVHPWRRRASGRRGRHRCRGAGQGRAGRRAVHAVEPASWRRAPPAPRFWGGARRPEQGRRRGGDQVVGRLHEGEGQAGMGGRVMAARSLWPGCGDGSFFFHSFISRQCAALPRLPPSTRARQPRAVCPTHAHARPSSQPHTLIPQCCPPPSQSARARPPVPRPARPGVAVHARPARSAGPALHPAPPARGWSLRPSPPRTER